MGFMATPSAPISRASIESFLTEDGKPTPRKTANYAPGVLDGSLREYALDGRPFFTMMEAERMRRDPTIDFGLRILRAPLYRVPFTVEADNPKVGRFVEETIRNFWSANLRAIANSVLTYGPSVGEVTHRLSNGYIAFDRFDDVHPRDARPLEYDTGSNRGQWAGVRVRGSSASAYSGGRFDIEPPHCFWFPGEAEYGRWWGRPRLAGAYEPFLEKRGKGGAVDSRRLGAKKCAVRGGSMRHPMGTTEYATSDGGTVNIDNEDLARQIVEKYENGGVLTLPNTRDEKGEYIWLFEYPAAQDLPQTLIEYPKELDKEMLTGLGIPTEVVQAAESGSGWAGRSVPAITFYSGEDELAGLALNCIDVQVCRPMVAKNFGLGQTRRYRIKPGSLVEMVSKDASQAGKMTEEPDPRQAQGGGLSSPKKQEQPEGGVQLSHAAQARLADKLHDLTESFSWTAGQTNAGHLKAIGHGEHEGKQLYGEEAKRVLSANGDTLNEAPSAPAVSDDELHHLASTVPSSDRGSWEKIKTVYGKVREAVFVAVAKLGLAAADLAPAILDTAEDYMTLKASAYGDLDAFKGATGISWGFAQTLVKHAIGLGFRAAGHRAELGYTPDQVNAAVEVLVAAFEAAGQSLGVSVPIDEATIRELVERKLCGNKECDQTDESFSFDESDHPRDDHGQFISKGEIEAAKADPAKAARLRERVGSPRERNKLESHLAKPDSKDATSSEEKKSPSEYTGSLQVDYHAGRKPLPAQAISIALNDAGIPATSDQSGATAQAGIGRCGKILIGKGWKHDHTQLKDGHKVDAFSKGPYRTTLEEESATRTGVLITATSSPTEKPKEKPSRPDLEPATIPAFTPEQTLAYMKAHGFAKERIAAHIKAHGLNRTNLSFNESDHPRDDAGQFVSKEELQSAKNDPVKAAELRARVTDPAQRKKLDAHIGGDEPKIETRKIKANEKLARQYTNQWHEAHQAGDEQKAKQFKFASYMSHKAAGLYEDGDPEKAKIAEQLASDYATGKKQADPVGGAVNEPQAPAKPPDEKATEPAAQEGPKIEPLTGTGSVSEASGLAKVTMPDGKVHFFKPVRPGEAKREATVSELAQLADVAAPAGHVAKVGDKDGVMTDWVDGTRADKDKAAFAKAVADDPPAATRSAMFHFLIGAQDKSNSNYMVSNGKIVTFDHGETLGRFNADDSRVGLDQDAALEAMERQKIPLDSQAVKAIAAKSQAIVAALRSKHMDAEADAVERRASVLAALANDDFPTEAKLRSLLNPSKETKPVPQETAKAAPPEAGPSKPAAAKPTRFGGDAAEIGKQFSAWYEQAGDTAESKSEDQHRSEIEEFRAGLSELPVAKLKAIASEIGHHIPPGTSKEKAIDGLIGQVTTRRGMKQRSELIFKKDTPLAKRAAELVQRSADPDAVSEADLSELVAEVAKMKGPEIHALLEQIGVEGSKRTDSRPKLLQRLQNRLTATRRARDRNEV